MIKILFHVILLIALAYFMDSCSDDSANDQKQEDFSEIITSYTYTSVELETMKLINDHRLSIGLNALKN